MWKEIKDYEHYLINEKGEIKNSVKGNILTPVVQKNGYAYINLRKKEKRKNFRVHRLIALAFIPNPEKKRTVNHKNGVRSDNRLENLEWMTHSENNKHSFTNLGRRPHSYNKFGKESKSSIYVNQLTLSGEFIQTFAGQQEAGRQLGICSSHIVDVCRGKRNQTGGFKWEYSNKQFKERV